MEKRRLKTMQQKKLHTVKERPQERTICFVQLCKLGKKAKQPNKQPFGHFGCSLDLKKKIDLL